MIYVLQAQDRFTQYGLVGAAWFQAGCIEQMVLSCRALGLQLEDALIAHIAHTAVAQGHCLRARLRHTEANLACGTLYSRGGFTQAAEDPGLWVHAQPEVLRVPAHVRLSYSG